MILNDPVCRAPFIILIYSISQSTPPPPEKILYMIPDSVVFLESFLVIKLNISFQVLKQKTILSFLNFMIMTNDLNNTTVYFANYYFTLDILEDK